MEKKLTNKATIYIPKCVICNEPIKLEVSSSDIINLERWERNECLIQEAVPNLSPSIREALISHICPACQESFFGDNPETCDSEVDIDYDYLDYDSSGWDDDGSFDFEDELLDYEDRIKELFIDDEDLPF